MNFLVALARHEKVTPDKGPVKIPDAHRQLSEPHKVTDPNAPGAKEEAKKYWDNRNLIKPVYQAHATQWMTYGGVVVDAQGRFLLREPTNHYDGYFWTFPKGAPDAGEKHTETALRETREETGYHCVLTREEPLGSSFYNKTGSKTVFYLMTPVEQVSYPDKETQQIKWASYGEAKALIAQSINQLGKLRDLTVLEYANEWVKSKK